MSRFAPKPISAAEGKAIVEAKLNYILSLCTPDQIFVFGSAASNEMTDHSDVDLALIFCNEAELSAARNCVFRRAVNDEWPQDLVLFLKSDFERKKNIGGLCQIIADEGICIFERIKP